MLVVKRTIFCITFLCSLTLSHWSVAQSKNITLNVPSKLTKQPLSVLVTLPANYEKESTKHYPVLYTTASNRRLPIITQQVDWMSHVSFGPIVPMIIVRLPYIEHPNEIQDKNTQASGLNTPLTIDILTQEILPLINKSYRIQPFSILEGYSTNANLPLNILAQAPTLFNAYISINPAWVLDKNQLLEKLKTRLLAGELTHRSLYISLGDFSQNNEAFFKFKQAVANSNSGLDVTLDDQRHINYYTAPMSLLPKALEAIFSDTHPKDFKLFASGGIKAVDKYYSQLALKYGYSLSPINTLHDLSDYYAEHKNPKAQIDTLTHILSLKPDNIFYHIMLANALFENQQLKKYQQMIEHAKQLAASTNNQEALDHINNIINRNKLTLSKR
jgi:predicted alpha/beta superfamily hydrolase